MRHLAFALVLGCAACGFGHDVEQDGSYTAIGGTRVTDSAPYPLETLLIVEEDRALEQTLLYLFTGNLRRADLGLEDLRRIAARHGGFQMSFDPVREAVDESRILRRGRPLPARVGEREIELVRIDDEGLRRTGASRYLSNVAGADFEVAAYFAAVEALAPIEVAKRDIDYEPALADPMLAVERNDESLELTFASESDYVVIELGQIIRRSNEEREAIDALVRTSLAPDAPYAVGATLLTDVAGQGCWSEEAPLHARLTQVARRYQQHAAGDWAVIHLRRDVIEVDRAAWTHVLGEATPSAYCRDFE